jgi:UDP:flavonoid glycosyltransferase YjiC (YdhE family)
VDRRQEDAGAQAASWLETRAGNRPVSAPRRALGSGRTARAGASRLRCRIWTPYWALEEEQPLDAALEQFVSAGPPPVYVGFGSMADPDPRQTLEVILGLPDDIRFVVSNERARRLCKEDPQIVIPHIVDQYYWACRVHELGIGPAPLRRVSLSARDLASAITSLRTGSAIQQAAKALGRVLADSAKASLAHAERCCAAALAAGAG